MALVIQDVITSYIDNYDPSSNENSVYNNIMPFYFWLNSDSKEIWMSDSPDNTNIVWRKLITSLNILAVLLDLGWNINSERESVNPGISFDDERMPNEDADTLVVLSVAQTSTLLAAAEVVVQVDQGSGFALKSTMRISGIAASITQSCTFLVPKGASYRIVEVSGSNAIANLDETSL